MTKKRKKKVILAIVAALLVVAVAVFWGSLREESGKALLKIMSDRVDLQASNIRFTEVGESGVKWEIVAASAHYQKKENLIFFDTFTVRLVTKDGSTFVMNGDRGWFNSVSKDMEAEGNVSIVSPQGDRLTTDRLEYRGDQQLISTNSPVLIEGQRVRIRGVGMIYSLEEKKASLLSKVQANAQGGLRGVR